MQHELISDMTIEDPPNKAPGIPGSLLDSLSDAAFYPHPVEQIERVETHISVLFLTGRYVYKLKKPVDFGFLDFTSLAARRFYCLEELRLNRRTAPQLYLDVVPIVSDGNTYRLGEALGSNQSVTSTKKAQITDERLEAGEQIVDYAVRMRQFDPAMQLDRLLEKGALPLSRMEQLAEQMASFHTLAEVADPSSVYGEFQTLLTPCLENFDSIQRDGKETALLLEQGTSLNDALAQLLRWTRLTADKLRTSFAERKTQQHVRECHGDLHLGNIALVDDVVTLFDCIEFSDRLRWIDTASDLAFTLMDLESREKPDYAAHLLNRYLEIGGDFDLLKVLVFYKVYRAMVRAKVAGLQSQTDALQRYIKLALKAIQPPAPRLYITFGFSGSGKTWGSRAIADRLGLIHIRSDVERKRLAGLEQKSRAGSDVGTGLYASGMTEKTYTRLAELAKLIVQSGFGVIVDATFLKETARRPFKELSKQLDVPFTVLAFTAETDQLEQNIISRSHNQTDASDADLAVLHHQLKHVDPLTADEPVIELPFGSPIPFQSFNSRSTR